MLQQIAAVVVLFGVTMWMRNPNMQGLHDRFAHTIVVSDDRRLKGSSMPEQAREKYVYAFEEGGRDQKYLLGGKGANLAEMTNLGLPVPPGFTISTDACKAYMALGDEMPAGLMAEVAVAREQLEKKMGKLLGDADDPLLVSVRSGAPFSMPGMMDTVLNLGLNDDSVKGLAKQTQQRALRVRLATAASCRCSARSCSTSPASCSRKRCTTWSRRKGVSVDTELDRRRPRRPGRDVQGDREEAKPASTSRPTRRSSCATRSTRCSSRGTAGAAKDYRRMEKIPDDLGTAVNVQTMVFGNKGDDSGTGVAFTRNPSTGEHKPYGDFLKNAQGEDVVAGIRITEPLDAMANEFPEPHKELLARDAAAREPLPRHVRHRVHDRAGQALHAADARRQAHRRWPRCAWPSRWSTKG